jgi:CubicO group peptidase (beta-lactamase class C family)
MKAYGVPGLSVAVVHNYQVAWAMGYGWADAKFQKPVTVETMFSAGSISKPVAAMAALKLVQDSKMQLDEPVNSYLKSWKVPDNDFTRKTPVTLRHLLSHTAGTTQHGLGGYTPDEPLPTLVQTLNGIPPAQTRPIIVNAMPGQEFRYSGGGTMVAQMAVMDVTGQRYTQFMEDTIFRKLGMVNSTYEQPLPPKAQRKASWAFSNQPWYKGMPYVYPDAAAAGLYTTPTDLAQFIIELQNALRGAKSRVLDQAHATMMVTPVKKDIEPGFYRSDIGLGIFLLQRTDNRDAPAGVYFTHSGLNAGFTADFVGSLQDGNGVVVMINNDDAMGLVKEVMRSVAKTYKWKNYFPDEIKPIPMTDKQLDRYVGRYKKDDDEVITFTREENHLLQKGVNWKIGVTVYPVGENTFAFTDYTLRGRFALDEHGKAKTFQTDWSEVMPKMKDGEFVPSELLKMGRIAEAVEGYRNMKGVTESQLTQMAYNLIKGKPTNLTAGLAIARLALELYPQSAAAHHRLAEAYEALGDNSRAIDYYQKVLELDAHNIDARERLKKLGVLNKKQVPVQRQGLIPE